MVDKTIIQLHKKETIARWNISTFLMKSLSDIVRWLDTKHWLCTCHRLLSIDTSPTWSTHSQTHSLPCSHMLHPSSLWKLSQLFLHYDKKGDNCDCGHDKLAKLPGECGHIPDPKSSLRFRKTEDRSQHWGCGEYFHDPRLCFLLTIFIASLSLCCCGPDQTRQQRKLNLKQRDDQQFYGLGPVCGWWPLLWLESIIGWSDLWSLTTDGRDEKILKCKQAVTGCGHASGYG